MENVSVPLRGLSYLNEQCDYNLYYAENHCFRPLTGTLLSKRYNIIVNKIDKQVSVPSRGLSYLNIFETG